MPSRVLVVEGNAVIRESMLSQLNSFGVNCYAVISGEEAVDLSEFFDLILTDIQLPAGISGIEATRRIRMLEQEKQLEPSVIVATTSLDNPSACLSAGMNDYFAKPIMREDLQRLLNRYIFSQPERRRLLG